MPNSRNWASKEIGILILPNLTMCRKLTKLGAGASDAEVLAAPAVRSFFQDMVRRLYLQGTGSASRVARALILLDPPSIDKGEITDKGSINQRAVLTHRAALVQALYDERDAAVIKPV